MDKLRTYLNSLNAREKHDFAYRCKTTLGYLRKAISKGQQLGGRLCVNIERESDGAVLCEDLRPDVKWWVLRGTSPAKPSTLAPTDQETDHSPCPPVSPPALITADNH
jgi:DNA-binding transcriptional regulator YdaS (Cro superfamily)